MIEKAIEILESDLDYIRVNYNNPQDEFERDARKFLVDSVFSNIFFLNRITGKEYIIKNWKVIEKGE